MGYGDDEGRSEQRYTQERFDFDGQTVRQRLWATPQAEDCEYGGGPLQTCLTRQILRSATGLAQWRGTIAQRIRTTGMAPCRCRLLAPRPKLPGRVAE